MSTLNKNVMAISSELQNTSYVLQIGVGDLFAFDTKFHDIYFANIQTVIEQRSNVSDRHQINNLRLKI